MDVRIGITTSLHDGEQRLDVDYVHAVDRAGGIPVIVPMVETADALDACVRLLHGLVITGGPAVTEGLIGDLPDDIDQADPIRARSDAAVLRAFLKTRRPVLGICYGMQMLNAVHGGTIYADVEANVDGSLTHSEQRGGTWHPIEIDASSALHAVLKRRSLLVNTRHIQAVSRVAEPFRIAARAPDGVVEAIENDDGTVLGVQFHPERMGSDMAPLFQNLVQHARRLACADNLGT
ncbi:MAG: type 1 glutamine amidotransferase [Rhodothermales bacterium]